MRSKAALRQSNVAERHAGSGKARAREGSRCFRGASESSQLDRLPPLKAAASDIIFTALTHGDISGIFPLHSLNRVLDHGQNTITWMSISDWHMQLAYQSADQQGGGRRCPVIAEKCSSHGPYRNQTTNDATLHCCRKDLRFAVAILLYC